jgi:hypothetical protein
VHEPHRPTHASREGPGGPPPPGEPAAPGLLIALLAAGAWLHRSALATPFFADDYLFLDQVRGRGLIAALASPDPLGNFFRPLSRQIYFWVFARLARESVLAFHVFGLALFLLSLGLLYDLARRLAGPRAAVVACGLLALHYAPDVPLLWGSGTQDLLALPAALLCLSLHRAGRRWPAAAILFCGLFCKETIVATPVIALVLDHRPRESWARTARRAWPLLCAWVAWAGIWIPAFALLAKDHTVLRAPGVAGLAALAHGIQVAVGLEPGMPERPDAASLLPALALVLIATWIAWMRRAGLARSSPAPDLRRAEAVGLTWALAGTLPVVAVVNAWSAYYYLFALCGMYLALAAWLSARPVWVSLLVICGVGLASEHSRQTEQFAVRPGAWAPISHINPTYVRRAERYTGGYLADLRRAVPHAPRGATFFFGEIQGSIAWQVGDGPFVRWVYRNPSVHSYFLSDMTPQRIAVGPVFVFCGQGDSLLDRSRDAEYLSQVAFGELLDENLSAARAAAELALRAAPANARCHYLMAWVLLAQGEPASAERELAGLGLDPRPGPSPPLHAAEVALGERDTLRARRALARAISERALDARAHMLMARLDLAGPHASWAGVTSAFAARVLAPESARAWKYWALEQMAEEEYEPAAHSLAHFVQLAEPGSPEVAAAESILAAARRELAGAPARTDSAARIRGGVLPAPRPH